MFPTGDPSHAADHPIFAMDFRGMLLSKTVIRTGTEDPPSGALKASGAKTVSSREFRMMGAEGQSGVLRVSTDFQAWESGERPIQKYGKRY